MKKKTYIELAYKQYKKIEVFHVLWKVFDITINGLNIQIL